MTRGILLLIFSIAVISCKSKSDRAAQTASFKHEEPKEEARFFPVTTYIRGQIVEIKKNHINPLLIINKANKSDSVWLKTSDFDSAFKDFLLPNIDTANLISYFSESKFADQTINSYTFTYTPKIELPKDFTLQRWDVYINPANSNVRKIFMVKRISPTSEMQLTWQSDFWCKTVIIETDKSGEQVVAKEQIITWNFE
jgi:hypothetical protein